MFDTGNCLSRPETSAIASGNPETARKPEPSPNPGRTAKATAAASVPATIQTGKGVIAIPPIANVEAIRISATDETASQRLGREPHRCRRSTNGIDRRLAAEHQDDKGERPQRARCRSSIPKSPKARTRLQKASRQIPMTTPAIVRLPIRQAFGIGRRSHIVRRQRHAEEVAGDHDDDHQQGRQNRVPGHDQADRPGRAPCTIFLMMEFSV